jgi:hypothetical protein
MRALGMAILTNLRGASGARYDTSLRYDWIALGLAAWYEGGFFFDGWAHTHIHRIESIFTPWHAVFYSGFVAVSAFLLGTLVMNRRKGMVGLEAVPRGYELSLVGVALFCVGAPIDLTYHYIYGVEQNLNAIITPTHLSFAVSIVLIATGPLRAAWYRQGAPRHHLYRALGPAVLSLTLALTMLTFFTLYVNPYVIPVAGYSYQQGTTDADVAYGIAGILLNTAILLPALLFLIRRWTLPVGSFTVILGLNTLEMVTVNPDLTWSLLELVAAGVMAGQVADILYRLLRPSTDRPTALRLFAFTVPFVGWLLYFLVLQLYVGIWWTANFWLGASLEAGIVGWLLSFLVAPPALPSPREATSLMPPAVTLEELEEARDPAGVR